MPSDTAIKQTAATATFVCAHCGSTRSVVRYSFADADKVIRECGACKLMVLDPFPTEEELHAVYNEGYFENENLTQSDVAKVYGYVDYISERINKQRNYTRVCSTLRRMVIASGPRPRLLDYGCGLGFFLDSAFDSGFAPSGVEFNRYALEYIHSRYAYRAFHHSEINPADRYDVVTMFDVIEHLRDPFEAIASVREMLHDNGVVLIATMDSTSFVSRIMGKRLEDFRRIREHLFFFSRGNMISILIKEGFDVLRIESYGHSFELRLLASRLRLVLPVVGAPMMWLLKIFPFAGRWSIYLDPRTKFMIYGRKRRERRPIDPSDLLSIVVPAYNEGATIERVLDALIALDVGMRKEVIVVDDGSGDATPEILARYEVSGLIRAIRLPGNRGKGAAVAAGVAATRGDYVVIQDADTEYDPADVPALLTALAETGALAVYGSRFTGRYRRTGAFLPTVANRLLTLASNLVNNLNMSDLMTGYKLFDGNLIRSIKLRSTGFEVEAEVTCRIARMGVPIVEAPITYQARTYLEGKKIRARDGWRTLYALIRYGLFKAD